MSTHEQMVRRFAENAGKPDGKVGKGDDFIVINPDWRGQADTIYSYGRHFPLAVIMPGEDGPRSWWLLNGDNYEVWSARGRIPSPSTRRHQGLVRDAVKATELPYITLSFTALREAGIRRDSIKPVHVLPDRYSWERRTRDRGPTQYDLEDTVTTDGPPTKVYQFRNWQDLGDGRWSYEAAAHHLGESVFRASYSYEVREPGYRDIATFEWVPATDETVSGEAYFLSAFDRNEPGFGLYFMAQLPDGAQPQTVDEALEMLKPADVVNYEKYGDAGPVLRQGDVFAIPTRETTRELPGPSLRSELVLGVNHMVTEARKDAQGDTYARGIMRHRPQEAGRRPEHRNLVLGDRKTWYRLARNTVPDGRSWSLGGDVD